MCAPTLLLSNSGHVCFRRRRKGRKRERIFRDRNLCGSFIRLWTFCRTCPHVRRRNRRKGGAKKSAGRSSQIVISRVKWSLQDWQLDQAPPFGKGRADSEHETKSPRIEIYPLQKKDLGIVLVGGTTPKKVLEVASPLTKKECFPIRPGMLPTLLLLLCVKSSLLTGWH